MSLVIILRVPDGIVMAADSLSTAMQLIGPVLHVNKCKSCGEVIDPQDLNLVPFPIPISASSYTQKLYSLFSRFGVASWGLGVINDRSVHYHIKHFESQNATVGNSVSLDATRDLLIEYFDREFQNWPAFVDPNAPTDWTPLGLQLGGFDLVNGTPVIKTFELHLGKRNRTILNDSLGCTFGGDGEVVKTLWDLAKKDPRNEFKYPLFSLQDAIDHAEFLISTTIQFQRFSNKIPVVGGEVDVALITPFRGFQWIRRKELMIRLEE